MSTFESAVSPSPEVETSTEVTTVPTSYTQAVQERIQILRRWREEIPHFVLPTSPDATRRLTTAASVPPEFIELAVVAMANEAALVRGDASTPDHLRDLAGYREAHLPLADELETLAQFIRHSAAAARYEAGSEALNVYALAQRLVKQPKYASLAPYVADMRRTLGRVRKPSPEAAAQKAADRAAKAAAKVAKRAPKALPAAADSTTQQQQ